MKSPILALFLATALPAIYADPAPTRPTVTVNGTVYPVYTEQPTSFTPPDYPHGAAKQGRGGTTTVVAVIDAKGKVATTLVAKSDADPEVQAAVVRAVRQWRYPVVRESGSPIAYAVMIPLKMEPAGAPAAKPGLAEIIADPKYLAECLGSKVLVLADPKTGSLPDELVRAIKQAKLDQGHQIIPLPPEATRPTMIASEAPDYPRTLRERKIPGEAFYLIFIGTDGSVRGMYCYKSDHPAFAAAGAAAVAKFRFKPAHIGGTPVPTLSVQEIEFVP